MSLLLDSLTQLEQEVNLVRYLHVVNRVHYRISDVSIMRMQISICLSFYCVRMHLLNLHLQTIGVYFHLFLEVGLYRRKNGLKTRLNGLIT